MKLRTIALWLQLFASLAGVAVALVAGNSIRTGLDAMVNTGAHTLSHASMQSRTLAGLTEAANASVAASLHAAAAHRHFIRQAQQSHEALSPWPTATARDLRESARTSSEFATSMHASVNGIVRGLQELPDHDIKIPFTEKVVLGKGFLYVEQVSTPLQATATLLAKMPPIAENLSAIATSIETEWPKIDRATRSGFAATDEAYVEVEKTLQRLAGDLPKIKSGLMATADELTAASEQLAGMRTVTWSLIILAGLAGAVFALNAIVCLLPAPKPEPADR